LRRDPFDGTPHFIICTDKPGTATLRAATRDQHLKHLGASEKVRFFSKGGRFRAHR
jgi:uncharacterized protein YciI